MKQTKQFLRPLLMAIVMLVGMLVPQGAWAQSSPVTVGDQGFSTIQEAIDEIVYGGLYDATLTLHQDFTLEGDIGCIDIYFNAYSEDFNFTIDLNGHTITGGCEWNNNDIYFRNDGSGLPTVTIANSCQDKKGKLFNCRLYLNPNTKVIVKEGVSLYPSFELLDFAPYVVHIESETSSVENYGDIYGEVMVGPGGSFINNGRVAYVNGEFENNGSHCAYFNWADDGSFFRVFVYDGEILHYNEEDEYTSITSVVTKEPTCTEPGLRTVTGTVFYGGQEFTDTKEVEIPAGHDYQVQNVVWSEDYTSATLQLVCSRDAEHTANVEVTDDITSEDTTPATCTTAGVRTYTAKATYEGETYTGTKEVEIPATGHDYTNKTLTASPVEDGLYAYACDNGCGQGDEHRFIKDFNGAGNHLELTKDSEGNYSTSEDITLADANGFASPIDFTAASVTYNRNIVMDDGMYSFIVPFDIPAAQAAELGTFYQYSKHEEGNVYFDNADGIVRANTAYFFKPAKDITSITVENPTFGTTGTMPDATNPSEPGLYGTYSQIEIPVGAYGYGNMGFFIKAGTDNKIKPFRAYLWLGSGASMAKARAFFGEEEANGIIDIDAESEHDIPAYDLSGQRVTDDYKGIVIKNGKKTMVR